MIILLSFGRFVGHPFRLDPEQDAAAQSTGPVRNLRVLLHDMWRNAQISGWTADQGPRAVIGVTITPSGRVYP